MVARSQFIGLPKNGVRSNWDFYLGWTRDVDYITFLVFVFSLDVQWHIYISSPISWWGSITTFSLLEPLIKSTNECNYNTRCVKMQGMQREKIKKPNQAYDATLLKTYKISFKII